MAEDDSTTVLIPLGDTALQHLRYELNRNGHTLAENLLGVLADQRGRISAILPHGTHAEAILDFRSGGAIRSSDALAFLANMISQRLDEDTRRVCIVENALASPTDGWLGRSTLPHLFLGKEVYHYSASDDSSPESVRKMLREADSDGLNGCVSSYDGLPRQGQFEPQVLRAIADDAILIFAAAFDHESFVVWHRN